jgi:hypothetical protein
MKTLLALLLLGGASLAHAADRNVIKPTCWEENVGSQVQRHCEVKRPRPGALVDTDQAVPPPPPAAAAPPPPAAAPPPTYYAQPPVRPWPTQACLYGPPPCPVY